MPSEESLSSRFDYLFEPLDDEAPVDAIDAKRPVGDSSHDKAAPSAAPVRMAFAAFVLGTLGVVAVIAVLLQQRSYGATDPVELPHDPTPLSTTVPNIPTQAAPVPSPPARARASEPTEVPQTVESVPRQVPVQQPATETRAPQTRTTNSPATRAPISVAPEIRAPAPSQEPGGNGRSGGLLGRGGLL